MTTAYIALGSNLNDPAVQLRLALTRLSALPGCDIEAISSAYSSAAVGPGEQPDYLNAVVKLATSLSATGLLAATQVIEDRQGRVRSERWGARTLDIDILLYGHKKIDNIELQVPHPRMTERNFVLYPLAEITGEQLPLPCGGVLGTLLANCPKGDLARTQVSLTTSNNLV
ncbi:MAG: 2-amino-4-hydroxy-6-hydroxymethyldihydropteridine diphosphokinase [Gammaproteobacteria bacterium]|nr:MAG: 2-amino-4-hydroxy-6-hydroxymethyldihydropteridine diphosphokinase [Gammaproteobacteria bacterium]